MSIRNLAMVVLATACLFMGGVEAWAKVAGHFTLIEGRVDVLAKKGDKAIPAKVGDKVNVGDIVRTKSKSRAQITLADKSLLNMGESSRMEIRRFNFSGGKKKKRDGMFHLFRGQLRSIVNHDKDDTAFNFKVETPTAVAAVRGTDYSSIVRSDSLSYFACRNGQVEIQNRNPNIGNPVVINANQFTQVASGFAPTAPKPIPPAMMNNLFTDNPVGDTSSEAEQGSSTSTGSTSDSTTDSSTTDSTTDSTGGTTTDSSGGTTTDTTGGTTADTAANDLPTLPEAPVVSSDGTAAVATDTVTLPGTTSTTTTTSTTGTTTTTTTTSATGTTTTTSTTMTAAPVVTVAPVVVTPPITTTVPAATTAPVTIQVVF